MLIKQLEEIEKQKKPIREKLNALYAEESDQIKAKVERCRKLQDSFQPEELIFSAHARCPCGAGLAYPKNIGIHGSWECSDILLGRAIPANKEGSKTHEGSLPFAFYEIKSEGQPSANGATTRPEN